MMDVGAPLFGEEPSTRVEQQIEYYGAIQKSHAGRLYCHVAVDHRRANCLDLIRRAVVDHKLVGIGEITPDGFSVADAELRPLMRLACDIGVPVQVHTRAGAWTDFKGADHSERNTTHPLHAARLARELPDLKVVLCHAGFPHWWQIAAEGIADLPNCVLDVSNWNISGLDDAELVARVATWRSLVGAERILFASDQPSGKRFTGARSDLPAWVAFFRALPAKASASGYSFSESEAAAILGGNASSFYGLT
jgi:predicted TIM-barrel fold metal-dependent hydrolase